MQTELYKQQSTKRERNTERDNEVQKKCREKNAEQEKWIKKSRQRDWVVKKQNKQWQREIGIVREKVTKEQME